MPNGSPHIYIYIIYTYTHIIIPTLLIDRIMYAITSAVRITSACHTIKILKYYIIFP